MLHIPIFRRGTPYESVDKVTLVHHATGEPVAEVNQVNPGMVVRDVHRMDDAVLERFSVAELLDICRRAAQRFVKDTLPVGDAWQSFDDYIRQLSATTGMPVTHCRTNAQKIHRVLAEMDTIVAGLTRGFDLDILDRGYGTSSHGATKPPRDGRTKGQRRRAHTQLFPRGSDFRGRAAEQLTGRARVVDTGHHAQVADRTQTRAG